MRQLSLARFDLRERLPSARSPLAEVERTPVDAWTHRVLAAALAMFAAFGVGCGNGVRVRFANELDCPQSQVSVTSLGAGGYRAIGCGRSAIYSCLTGGWGSTTCVLDHYEQDPDPLEAEASEQTAWDEHPQPLVERGQLNDRPAAHLLLGDAWTHLELWASQGGTATGQVELRSGDQCADAEVRAGDQRCTFEPLGAGGRFRVPLDALSSIARERGSAQIAICGRSRPLTEDEQSALARFVDLARGLTDAPAGSANPADPLAPLRQAIQSRREEIHACVGATVAVRLTWDANGSARVSLQGRPENSAEEQCVRAALGPLHAPAGSAPGTLIEAVRGSP